MTEPTEQPQPVETVLAGDSGAAGTEYGAEVYADAVRRAEQANGVEPYHITGDPDSLVVRVLDEAQRVHVLDLEAKLDEPRRGRGTAVVFDGHDFTEYVNRLSDDATTVWADEDRGNVTAVFNDHHSSDIAGWRDHTAHLSLKDDPEWTAWLAMDGKWFGQLDFAEFLQDRASSVVAPDAATILEIAIGFKAHKKADFNSEVDLTTGSVQFTYNEQVAQSTKSGQMELPTEITVSLAPYLGMDPVQMVARLRWNLDGGGLQLGYRIHRPDLVKRQAFAQLRDEIAAQVAAPVLLGSAPPALTAHS